MTTVFRPTFTRESLARMGRYRALADALAAEGREFVTLAQISGALGVPTGAVTDDLRALFGQDEVGFELNVSDLGGAAARYLGRDNHTDVFLAGTTPLAKSILACGLPERHGLNVAAVFADDPILTGGALNGRPVLPLAKLPELSQRMSIRLGIIAVNEEHAQAVADLMVLGAITGIICCGGVAPAVPEDVALVQYDLAESLHQLVSGLCAKAEA